MIIEDNSINVISDGSNASTTTTKKRQLTTTNITISNTESTASIIDVDKVVVEVLEEMETKKMRRN